MASTTKNTGPATIGVGGWMQGGPQREGLPGPLPARMGITGSWIIRSEGAKGLEGSGHDRTGSSLHRSLPAGLEHFPPKLRQVKPSRQCSLSDAGEREGPLERPSGAPALFLRE